MISLDRTDYTLFTVNSFKFILSNNNNNDEHKVEHIRLRISMVIMVNWS